MSNPPKIKACPHGCVGTPFWNVPNDNVRCSVCGLNGVPRDVWNSLPRRVPADAAAAEPDPAPGTMDVYRASEARVSLSIVEAVVLSLKRRHQTKWRKKSDFYWLSRLMEEVGELASSLQGEHKHTPEAELIQIASVAMNWLEKRGREDD